MLCKQIDHVLYFNALGVILHNDRHHTSMPLEFLVGQGLLSLLPRGQSGRYLPSKRISLHENKLHLHVTTKE